MRFCSWLPAALLLPALAVPPLCHAQTPAATRALTLEEALAQLHSASDTLRAAEAEVREREEEGKAARGLYWPHIGLHADATHLNDAVVLDLDPIRQVINTLHHLPASVLPPFESTFQKQDFWLARLEATWPIYTGGRAQAANKAAALQVEDAGLRRTATAQALSTELVRRYFALRLTIRSSEVRKAAADLLAQHVRHAKRLEEEGQIARVERLHAEVALAKASREHSASLHDVALARTALAGLLAMSDAPEPASELFLVSDPGPLESFVAAALLEHPGLQRLDAQRRLADVSLGVEKGRWKPDVAVFGMRELHTADLSLVSPTWAVGIAAKVTLFDGFERKHKTAAARSRQERVDALAAQARRDISTLVEQKYRAATRAREQFVSLNVTVDLASEALRARTRAFEEGFAASVDVVDAQVTLQQARLQRLATAYEFDVALAELLEASGQPGLFADLRRRADLFPER